MFDLDTFSARMSRRLRYTPVQFCNGMGVDSAALLTRWLLEPGSRDFDLADLTVVTAMTGDEHARTAQLMRQHLLPLMRANRVRYVQVCRAGQLDEDGYVVLDDSDHPAEMHMQGPWRLSNELLANGTLPTMKEPRKCSLRAKGFPLDLFGAAEYGSMVRRCAVGFAAEEQGRADGDTQYSGPGRDSFYPLIDWEWDRDDCARYLKKIYGVDWERSCCEYCPFSGGTLVKNAAVARRWRADPDAAERTIALEYLSLCLNPNMALYKDYSAREVAQRHGLGHVVDAADAAISSRPWALYEVRRVFRRRGDTTSKTSKITMGDDRKAKGHPWRSVRTLATGRASTMSALVYGHREGRLDDDGLIARRRLIDPRDTFPNAERFLVAGPAGVVDKQRPRFELVWDHALAQQRRKSR